MATTFHFSHNTSYRTFISVHHNATIHSRYAIVHEYMHPPHNDSSVALYAWDHEEPMFIGDFGCIIEHWGDYVNISLSCNHTLDLYSPHTHELTSTFCHANCYMKFPHVSVSKDSCREIPSSYLPLFLYWTKLTRSQKRIGLIPLGTYVQSHSSLHLYYYRTPVWIESDTSL